jgi:ATP-binding cassette subfamily F protein 2
MFLFRQFSGNYDTFMNTLEEQEEHQMKRFNKEQVDLAKMKEYVARFGHGNRKLAKQGKSKEKLMNKRIAEGMTESVFREKTVKKYFM